jgi:hypothetical protein
MTLLLADQKSVILGIIANYIYDSEVKVTKENGISKKQLLARSQRSEILKKGTYSHRLSVRKSRKAGNRRSVNFACCQLLVQKYFNFWNKLKYLNVNNVVTES